ncbi:MAG: SDR family NAD(P)-dependent oxidoreductase [Solirubrobacteraceae bacterium]
MELDGRRTLVTGATGGLGQAIARALASRGASLVLSGRRIDVLEPLARETGAQVVAADLADRCAVGALIEQAGAVDVLVANAAVPASGRLEEYAEEQIDRALDVNLRAPILLAQRLGEGMVARSSGHLVFVSSLSGKVATSGSALYSATKFGLRGFAMGLRQDLRDRGVGVSCVFPGPIEDAGMFADTGVSLPRLAGSRRPEDVAEAVVQAIECNRGEVDVAPLQMRIGAALAGAAPSVVTRLQQRLGADEIAARVGNAQRGKR